MVGQGGINLMSFYLEEETEVSFDFDYKVLAEEIINHCLDYANFPYEAEVNLTLTDNEGIHSINKEFRQIDRPTDVLSFPMLNYKTPGDFTFLDDEDSDDFNPDDLFSVYYTVDDLCDRISCSDGVDGPAWIRYQDDWFEDIHRYVPEDQKDKINFSNYVLIGYSEESNFKAIMKVFKYFDKNNDIKIKVW